MSSTLTIYGASDDLVEIEGPIRDEYTLGINDRTVLRLETPGTETSPGEALEVIAEFTDRAWELSVRAVTSEWGGADKLPAKWPIRFGERPIRRVGDDHDPAVFIEAPGGVTVRNMSDLQEPKDD